MSIINEALKKAEQSIHKNPAKETLPPNTKHAAKPYILYILILVTGLFLSNFIFTLISHKPQGDGLASDGQSHKLAKTKTAAALNIIEPAVKAPAKMMASEPSPVIPPAPQLEENEVPETAFILNGIFFSDNDGYALVNNQIVRENDLVDGAKVKTITANTIELDNAGKIVTLATQR